jgi:cytidylate kinase
MVRAEDAVEIDTSLLGLDDVVGRVVDMARAQQAVSHG